MNVALALSLLIASASAATTTRELWLEDGDLAVDVAMDGGEVGLTLTATTTGYVVLGFAHAAAHEDGQTEYDALMAGVDDDGNVYADSYTLKGSRLERTAEKRFKIVSGEEDGGVTTVTVERDVSLCYWESFAEGDVGDLVLVYYVLGDDDPDDVEPMPEDFNVIATAAKQGHHHAPLFSGVMAPAVGTLSTGDGFLGPGLDRHDPEGAASACAVSNFVDDGEQVKYFIAFEPKLGAVEDDVEMGEKIKMMALFQCNNEKIANTGETVDTDVVSSNGCRDGPLENIHLMCQDVLYVFTPGNGTQREQMTKGYGIKANKPDDDGNRYFMLLTIYNDDYDGDFRDESYIRAFFSESDDLTAVSKLMVGHHLSSKMVVLPSGNWSVQGVCSSGCTGLESATDAAEVKVVAASLHYGPGAISASIRISQDDPDSTVDIYDRLLVDKPAVKGFVPSNRDVMNLGAKLDLSVSDVVVQCTFSGQDLKYGDVETSLEAEFCFGTLTVEPPLALSTCTSVPTEDGLARAMSTTMDKYKDGTGQSSRRRKRRRRQAPAIIDEFYDRDIDGGRTVGERLEEMATAAKASQATADDYNAQFLLSKVLPVCVRGSDGGVEDLEPVEILQLADRGGKSAAPEVTKEQCDALARSNDDVEGEEEDDDEVNVQEQGGDQGGSDLTKKGGEQGGASAPVPIIVNLILTITILHRM